MRIMSRPVKFKFCLYVADDSPNGAQAIANLMAICRQYLPNRYAVEIVDVLVKPERALADGIFMTPTLVKIAPPPGLRIVGTLSETLTVIQALGLETLAA
jgi:circadian clock protein KaiB